MRSIAGAIDTLPPVSRIIFQVVSFNCVQWTYSLSGPIKPNVFQSAETTTHDVRGYRDPYRARQLPVVRIRARVQGQRQQLVVRREILSLDPRDVLGEGRACDTGGAGIDRSSAGLPQSLDTGVRMGRCVRDLRQVYGRGNACMKLAKRRHQF